ncbi:hypothetical protein [Pedobacter sp. UYEF25]
MLWLNLNKPTKNIGRYVFNTGGIIIDTINGDCYEWTDKGYTKYSGGKQTFVEHLPN